VAPGCYSPCQVASLQSHPAGWSGPVNVTLTDSGQSVSVSDTWSVGWHTQMRHPTGGAFKCFMAFAAEAAHKTNRTRRQYDWLWLIDSPIESIRIDSNILFPALVCVQPPRSTQPPTLSGTRNEYRPKYGNALRLSQMFWRSVEWCRFCRGKVKICPFPFTSPVAVTALLSP